MVILLSFLAAARCPRMWKHDVSKAFRRCPIAVRHLDISWVVFMASECVWASQHLGMPFGATSAVYAWHRLGNLLAWVILTTARAPLGRYVDDFFGASVSGIRWSGGKLLDVLGLALGLPMDPGKSVDAAVLMDVLGIEVDLNWARKLVSTCVSVDKAHRWASELDKILEEAVCSPELASTMAGRLSLAVTATWDRVGRVFVKPVLPM